MEGFDDPDPDSDYDYEETYSKRRKRRGGGGKPGRGASPADSGAAKKTGKVCFVNYISRFNSWAKYAS